MKPTGLDLSQVAARTHAAQAKESTDEPDNAAESGHARKPKLSSRDGINAHATEPAPSPAPARSATPSRAEPSLSTRAPIATVGAKSPRGSISAPSDGLTPASAGTFTTMTAKKASDPADLARRLIQAESQNGMVRLEGQKVTAILRERVELDGVNIIEKELKPFMKQHFETPAIQERLDAVTQAFHAIQPQIAEFYANLGGKDFARDPKVMALMEPVTAPLMDFIFGKDRMISSSGLPTAVVALFWAVDDQIVAWFTANGSGNPVDLNEARHNALVSFFGTRSFMADWTIKLKSTAGKAGNFYTPLIGFTNTYLNLKLRPFTQQLMDCEPEKRSMLLKQKAIISSRSSRFEKKHQEAGPTSPRSTGSGGIAMKENAHRRAAQDQARRKEVDSYSAQMNLPLINRDFFMQFKEDVLGLELQTYREVKANWDAFCLQSLSLFIAEKEDAGEKIAQSLFALKDNLKEKLKEISDN